jgi:5,10-methylenetetrahydromethanopterin reductase
LACNYEQIQKAKHFVSDDVVMRVTASGTPDEARAKVHEYVENGCTCPILYPVGGDVHLLIDNFHTRLNNNRK